MYVYRDNVLIADSISTVDDVQSLYLTNILPGDYDIRVTRVSGTGLSEQFGLAWSSTAVPEPATIALAIVGGISLLALRRTTRSRLPG